MVQSVELLLDAVGDAGVRDDWDRLRLSGLPSQGRIAASSNRPHITVAVADRLAMGAEDAIEALAGRLLDRLPIQLVLGGLLVFPARRMVLARSVVPAAELLALHAEFAVVMSGFADIPDTMLPGLWTPHITLARGVTGAALAAAVDVVRHDPVNAWAVAIRRWDDPRAGSGPSLTHRLPKAQQEVQSHSTGRVRRVATTRRTRPQSSRKALRASASGR